MSCFLCMAPSSDPHFCVIHRAGVPLVTRHNSGGVDYIVLPQSGGFRKLLIEELHLTPFSGHLGVIKLTHVLLQRVWWPKLRETVTSFVYSYTTCVQTKDSTGVPLGLLQPLPVPESRFSSWSIDFTTDLPLSHRCNTILTCVDCLTKHTTLIPCKMGY